MTEIRILDGKIKIFDGRSPPRGGIPGRDPWGLAKSLEKHGKINVAFPAETRGSKDEKSPFDGETPSPRPRPYLPPRLFLPRACSSFPAGLDQRSSRGKKKEKEKKENINTIAFSRGPVPPSRPGNFG